MSRESTAENPLPVSEVSSLIGGWLGRLGSVWVDGEVSEIRRQQGMAYLTLRDRTQDMSLSVSVATSVIDRVQPRIDEGMHIVVNAQVTWWTRRGQVSLRAAEIKAVGAGVLLARIEQLRQQLLAEGLLDASRKQPLPFLPRTIGLICGRESDAEKDVVRNARLRWPAAQFAIKHVPVQGPQCPPQVMAALAELDNQPDVDVIVIARGGGSVEDLIGFSDEALCRAVAACRTPVVSAIGHEADHPVLDDVADVRASTPTDAARRVVPDVDEQREVLNNLMSRVHTYIRRWVDHEQAQLSALRSRPCLASPQRLIDAEQDALNSMRRGTTRTLVMRMKHADEQLQQVLGQLRALSPQATLSRGYAIVQTADGSVVTEVAQTQSGDRVRVRVSDGTFDATVSSLPAAGH